MANRIMKYKSADAWEFIDLDGDSLNVQDRGVSFSFYTDCERWEWITLSNTKTRELRDWLTAKLEGNDEQTN